MRCIYCNASLEVIDAALPDVLVLDGVVFDTVGGYGSAVFDPMSNEQIKLSIAICDKCIVISARLNMIVCCPDGKLEPWSPSA